MKAANPGYPGKEWLESKGCASAERSAAQRIGHGGLFDLKLKKLEVYSEPRANQVLFKEGQSEPNMVPERIVS